MTPPPVPTTSPYIQLSVHGNAGWITLNRPQALNALDEAMNKDIYAALKHWQDSDTVKAVVLDSALPRFFCAGGDVKKVYQTVLTQGPEGIGQVSPFFAMEYGLNYFLSTYPKPVVPLMAGLNLGGGMGLAMHNRYRLVTDGALLAMPETALGFFPDVGAARFLQQCPGAMGYFFGLTGWRLTPAQALWANLATHYIPQSQWEPLKQALKAPFSDLADVISTHSAPAPADTELLPHVPVLEQILAADDLETVLDALDMSGLPLAQDVAAKLQTYSPTSMKVWQYHWQQSQGMPFSVIIKNDYRLAWQFLQGHDFFEGIRAILIDKDKAPTWRPAVLAAVTQEMISTYYQPPTDGDLALLA